ncbi:MAG: HD domain-containing protein [Agriterribacter sp.]
MTTSDRSLLEFYFQVTKLKTTVRKGWTVYGIPNPESVADHTFGVVVLAFLFAGKYKLNIEKVLILALIHDVAETIIGDITPLDNVTEKEKLNLETEAMEKIFSVLSNKASLMELWLDYQRKSSFESRLVFQLDKLELALQARRYEGDFSKNFDDFYTYAIGNVIDSEFKIFIEEIKNFNP